MKLEFARGLRECYEDYRKAEKRWGEAVARKYVQRIDILKVARTSQELRTIRSLRLHRLHGERDGSYTADLHDRWRLVLSFDDLSNTVTIEEVSNHYGD